MSAPNATTIVDLPSLSANLPMPPSPEVPRTNVVNTLRDLLKDRTTAATVEGPEGIGKTTVLAQFVRQNPTTAFSLFVTAANHLSFDPDFCLRDLASQINWALTGDHRLGESDVAGLLKGHYLELHRRAKQTRTQYYFVVDGIDELDPKGGAEFIARIAEMLPIGFQFFRFLLSGDESRVKHIFNSQIAVKPYVLTELSVEESRVLLGDQFDPGMAGEITGLCRGVPLRLAEVRRVVDAGADPCKLLRDGENLLQTLFEFDWKQVDQRDYLTLDILALLAHDTRERCPAEIARILGSAEAEVLRRIHNLTFLPVDPSTSRVKFVSAGLRRYAAKQLAGRKNAVIERVIGCLTDECQRGGDVTELAEYLESSARFDDLVGVLTPKNLMSVLARSRSLSGVARVVSRGISGATKLKRDREILLFGMQHAVVTELATRGAWESEVAALAALGRESEALSLANGAVLMEDQLQLLSALARAIWIRGEVVPSEILEQIHLLVSRLDFSTLGARARKVASLLVCAAPDLAATLLKAAGHDDEGRLDREFSVLAIRSLTEIKDERRREQILESIVQGRQDPGARALLKGVRVLSGRLNPEEACRHCEEIDDPEVKLRLLRYWCVLNGDHKDAWVVASRALDVALATTSIKVDSSLLADISGVLPAAEGPHKGNLISRLDGVRGTAERHGPSIDYVRLQLALSEAEADADPAGAELRFSSTVEYACAIGDLPTRGEALARCLGASSRYRSSNTPLRRSAVNRCKETLDDVVVKLVDGTASHDLSLGDIIAAVSQSDLKGALEYSRLVNTQDRRDSVLKKMVEFLLERPRSAIDLQAVSSARAAISRRSVVDDVNEAVLRRFADAGNVNHEQRESLREIVRQAADAEDSAVACRSLVWAIKCFSKDQDPKSAELADVAAKAIWARWQSIDAAWLRIDAGFGIAMDLAGVRGEFANQLATASEALKADRLLASPNSAAIFLSLIRIATVALSGLFHREAESESDLEILNQLVSRVPCHGERACIWADVAMRATIAGRQDLARKIVEGRVLPSLAAVANADVAYRKNVLVRVAPALYCAQPKRCVQLVGDMDPADADVAIYEILRFLLSGRVPSDPTEGGATHPAADYDKLLQVVDLAKLLNTDWMIYSCTKKTADLLTTDANRRIINSSQRENVSTLLEKLAKERLPIASQIAHGGFRIAATAQARRIRRTGPRDWEDLIRDAESVENIADRAYVLEIVALCLPAKMSDKRDDMLKNAANTIAEIPWSYDVVERCIGLAEELCQIAPGMGRNLVKTAFDGLSRISGDTREQQRRLVDAAYRLDEAFASELIEKFDDDQARLRAKRDISALRIRRSIASPQAEESLERLRSAEKSRVGWLLLRGLNSGRIQTLPTVQIRPYLEMAAGLPMSRAYPLLLWYVRNWEMRVSGTDQAADVLRPILESTVVAADVVLSAANNAELRSETDRSQSVALSPTRSLVSGIQPREVIRAEIKRWMDRYLSNEVIVHDPYFRPPDVEWIQLIRSVRPKASILVVTSRIGQRGESAGAVEDQFAAEWSRRYDQAPPQVEIAVIGGEGSGQSPIHDRWLLSGTFGLRFGSSLNALGGGRDTEVSELSETSVSQCRARIESYLRHEITEMSGERLRLSRFWL